MSAPLPFLRSPPFPRVPPWVAAVSEHVPRTTEPAPGGGDDMAGLINAIRRARVGGTFWAPAAPRPVGWQAVLRPRSVSDAIEMAHQALGSRAPERILAVLPDQRWTVHARTELARLRIAATGLIDPWSVIGPGRTAYVHSDDEYRMLAGIAGASVAISDLDWAAQPASVFSAQLATALLDGIGYRDPFTGMPITAQAAVLLLAEWRRMLDANRPIAAANGIAWWKRAAMEQFLWVGRRQPLRFTRSTRQTVSAAVNAAGAIAAWPSRMPADLPHQARIVGIPLFQMEDGFVRSVGLGSDLFPPCSIVVDPQGVYYDPTQSSALETLLATADFPPALLARAEALTAFILRQRISKYAAGGAGVPSKAAGRRRVLVAGQVEDDRSVALGGAGVAGNLDLLARARAAEPEAELWFRPHPDVNAGHRKGAIPDAQALTHADRVMRSGSMADMLDGVDGVHVLTSLTGFEALLRGLDVTVHGQPFYAGWGLTRDLAPPLARRMRSLTVPQLVAATLILYPRYLDPVTGLPCSAEVLMQRFTDPHVFKASWLTRLRRVEGRVRRAWARRSA